MTRASAAASPEDLCVLLATILIVGGCMTTGDGAKMRADLDSIERRMESHDRDRSKATAEVAKQVAELRTVMEQAVELLERNAADAGLQISRSQADLTALQSRVDEIAHQLEEVQHLLSRARTGTNRTLTETLPVDAERLWEEGNRQLNADRFDEARRLLRSFVENHADDHRAPQATFLLGESYFRQDKFAAAIGQYQRVIDRYGSSALVEDAMVKVGLSFLELKDCSKARPMLAEVLKRYPRSRHEGVIRSKLAEIDRGRRSRRVCAS